VRASPPRPPTLGPEAPRPNPQSQSFSRSYGSILPTSLTYIVLSTRGCTPWRPDAVMSTTWGANNTLPRIFKGRRERIGHTHILRCFPSRPPLSPAKPIPGTRKLLTRKDNSCRGSRWRLRVRLCCHTISTSRFGNVNPIPCRQAAARKPRVHRGFPAP